MSYNEPFRPRRPKLHLTWTFPDKNLPITLDQAKGWYASTAPLAALQPYFKQASPEVLDYLAETYCSVLTAPSSAKLDRFDLMGDLLVQAKALDGRQQYIAHAIECLLSPENQVPGILKHLSYLACAVPLPQSVIQDLNNLIFSKKVFPGNFPDKIQGNLAAAIIGRYPNPVHLVKILGDHIGLTHINFLLRSVVNNYKLTAYPEISYLLYEDAIKYPYHTYLYELCSRTKGQANYLMNTLLQIADTSRLQGKPLPWLELLSKLPPKFLKDLPKTFWSYFLTHPEKTVRVKSINILGFMESKSSPSTSKKKAPSTI